ncbi:winged helix-turn-helix domain-containing protein [Bradyrhizobium jicamae]|uniref:Winged helix-turn-helix domain-containing protein n=1 Tax=Bradyrhizobium jicamae TaxID=280332 RepID=A0ABS5FVZ5_9BRAD|nr:tetratricopeptide repeat protein [Bradyrhizobium jicamae]MBR0800918.1 winged helix-turn-helix domain-containing protein [Bradyrhizobium jicamae]
MLRFAGFELDPQQARLRGPDGEQIRLRPKSFDMLHLFAANAGRVLSKQELFEAIWPNVHVADDSLFQCIREVRAALGDDRRQLVKLVSGRGYLFEAEVSTGTVGGPAGSETAPPIPATNPGRVASAEPVFGPGRSPRSLFGQCGPTAIVLGAGLCAIIGIAVAAPVLRPSLIFKRTPSIVAMAPIGEAGNDARGAAVAAGVTDRLADGLARIENIRVIAPRYEAAGARAEPASAPSAPTDFEVRGELQRAEQAWILRARLIRTATGEVQTVATVSVDVNELDAQLEQSRLAAGVGHLLAVRLNGLLEGSDASAAASSAAGSAKTVIEQATASINQTSRERFGMAQTMLEKALVAEPDNVDLAVALAALQLRGIQMVWYSPDDARAAEAHAGATLERALRARPNSIPVLETYCRFLSATNHFVESLVTCSRALNFDPWDGLALYLVGLGQIYLGRFEDALATFQQADRYDTPQVSRWTWLLGAGWANATMGRYDDALPWLQRSIAITPASGRSHMLLAAAYQKLGRTDEARAAMNQGLRLRPGTTALNVSGATGGASPVFLEATRQIIRLMVAAGLPES